MCESDRPLCLIGRGRSILGRGSLILNNVVAEIGSGPRSISPKMLIAANTTTQADSPAAIRFQRRVSCRLRRI